MNVESVQVWHVMNHWMSWGCGKVQVSELTGPPVKARQPEGTEGLTIRLVQTDSARKGVDDVTYAME